MDKAKNSYFDEPIEVKPLEFSTRDSGELRRTARSYLEGQLWRKPVEELRKEINAVLLRLEDRSRGNTSFDIWTARDEILQEWERNPNAAQNAFDAMVSHHIVFQLKDQKKTLQEIRTKQAQIMGDQRRKEEQRLAKRMIDIIDLMGEDLVRETKTSDKK